MSRRIRTFYTLRARIPIYLDGSLEDHEFQLGEIEANLRSYLEALPGTLEAEVEAEHEETVVEDED